ncbi:hypothetical protein MYX77_07240 [Acidobacteriia bacterium AH_259_A11_L15]|nr:hypothetical protein [Acidobacteriia bacterium AH_259_A11_L15]
MSSHANPQLGGRRAVRRRLIVDPGLQLRAQIPLLVFAGVYALLLALLVFIPLHRDLADVAAEPDLRVRTILQHTLSSQLSFLHFHVWPLLGMAGVIGVYVGLRWSLRVAGPLYRLHRTLVELATEGETRTVRFRRTDEFRVFEEDLIQLNQKMKMVAARNRDILFAVQAHLKKLAKRLAADEIIPRADLEEAVYAMLAQLEKAPEIRLSVRR